LLYRPVWTLPAQVPLPPGIHWASRKLTKAAVRSAFRHSPHRDDLMAMVSRAGALRNGLIEVVCGQSFSDLSADGLDAHAVMSSECSILSSIAQTDGSGDTWHDETR
jgi:hypothetical protein